MRPRPCGVHIIANGIRFTGMPGWAASHSREEIWRYVSLVRQLPRLSEHDLRGSEPVGTAGHESPHVH
jgi:hypothetical protein